LQKFVATLVVISLILSLSGSVLAQEMTHESEYIMDGSIDLEKQVGHLCNTGAEMKQTIKGEGEMTKVMDTAQVAGVLTVTDDQDWVTAEDAVRNLTVTSVIDLCAPPKSVFAEYVAEEIGELENNNGENLNNRQLTVDNWFSLHEGITIPVEWLYEIYNIGTPLEIIDPLTDQTWAVQVEADAGFSGGLSKDFEAAYGPWAQHHGKWLMGVEAGEDSADSHWWFIDAEGEPLPFFGNRVNGQPIDGPIGVDTGPDYVGNYFSIDQMARTSQGTTKRYIDISSPWSHALAYEDMSVTGFAEIEDSFEMDNIEPGAEVVPDWWELF